MEPLKRSALPVVKSTAQYCTGHRFEFLLKSCIFKLQVYSLVLQGRISDARELLAQNSERQSGEYDVSNLNFIFRKLHVN